MEKTKIILDCDPGHDDAIAIILASLSFKIELLGISVASGNQTLRKTGNNALNIIEYLNKDIPVALGVDRPIIKDVEICSEIHGDTGLDGYDFPAHIKSFDSRNGVNLIIDLAMSNDKVTMVSTGPLTNLALAIRLEPKILDHIEKIVLMGGSIVNGNVTPAAEFNIYEDPEAAYIVFNNSIVDVYMVGLDVTRQVLVLPSIIERMERLNSKSSDLFTKLMKVFNENEKKYFGLEGGPLHDPATIVSIIDNSVITFQKMHVEIDITHGISYGRTNCDITGFLRKKPNVYVATKIDVDKYWDIIESILSKY